MFKKIFSFIVVISMTYTSFAEQPLFPPLTEAQTEAMQCDIIERNSMLFGFSDGAPLGKLQIIQNVDRADIPFELRYTFSEASQKDYDLSTHDRFPSSVGIVRAKDLVITDKPDKTPEEIEVDQQKASMKGTLDYFAGMASVETPEDVYGYLLFTDAQNLSFVTAFLSQEGRLLGLAGVLYQTYRFSCKSEAPPVPDEEEAPVEEETPAPDEEDTPDVGSNPLGLKPYLDSIKF